MDKLAVERILELMEDGRTYTGDDLFYLFINANQAQLRGSDFESMLLEAYKEGLITLDPLSQSIENYRITDKGKERRDQVAPV